MLVTLVVAARKPLANIDVTQEGEIELLLKELAELDLHQLIALEVIWTPAAEEDRMSTDELESHYPELTRLTETGGRVFCSYCAGPFTAELAKCPHCGAPSESGASEEAAPADR